MFAHGCSFFFSKHGWIRIWELGAWDREPFFFVHAAKKSRLIITLFTKLVGGGTEARDAATAPPFALLPRPAAARRRVDWVAVAHIFLFYLFFKM
jgi:hypothetical protein